jgi:polysaccharide pyruvyl transferase WcaK-like protein
MIGLVGYFNYGNYGDELFLQIWKEKLGNNNVRFLHSNDSIEDIDKIVIGGGDLIIPNDINNNYFNYSWLAKKIYIYGIGASSTIRYNMVENTRLLYYNFFDKCEYISTRDIKSFYYIRDYIGVKKTGLVQDLVWNYTPKFKIKKESNAVVGLTYRRNPWVTVEEISKICVSLIDKGFAIELIPLQDGAHNTRVLHKLIYEEVCSKIDYPNVNIIPPNYDVDHKYKAIASCSYYITTAFHGMITALKERVPVICFNQSNKFETLIEQIKMPFILCKKEEFKKSFENIIFKKYIFNESILSLIEESARKELNDFMDLVK